jgi:hypothetical protein
MIVVIFPVFVSGLFSGGGVVTGVDVIIVSGGFSTGAVQPVDIPMAKSPIIKK